jgi:predicted nucleotide-binding protein (sugar kinase/HSP70/actin superfamily)
MKYEAPPVTRRARPRDGRIGVPRSLAFDELRGFFDRVLAAHGLEIVLSPPSSARILERGLERGLDEVCFPLKVLFGHVAALGDAGVDTVWLPRLASVAKGRNLCPKFHVLPDLVASAFPGLRVVAPYVDLHHSKRPDLLAHLHDALRPALEELDVFGPASPALLAEAWHAARHERDAAPGVGVATTGDGRLQIAVLGHLYAERDPFLGQGVITRLERLGAEVVIGPPACPPDPVPLEAGLYYEPAVRVARSLAAHLAGGVDGVVLLTYFACGPDSYTADTLLLRLKKLHAAVPVLRLILDEQTSAEGLDTRLATFVDVARHQRERRC